MIASETREMAGLIGLLNHSASFAYGVQDGYVGIHPIVSPEYAPDAALRVQTGVGTGHVAAGPQNMLGGFAKPLCYYAGGEISELRPVDWRTVLWSDGSNYITGHSANYYDSRPQDSSGPYRYLEKRQDGFRRYQNEVTNDHFLMAFSYGGYVRLLTYGGGYSAASGTLKQSVFDTSARAWIAFDQPVLSPRGGLITVAARSSRDPNAHTATLGRAGYDPRSGSLLFYEDYESLGNDTISLWRGTPSGASGWGWDQWLPELTNLRKSGPYVICPGSQYLYAARISVEYHGNVPACSFHWGVSVVGVTEVHEGGYGGQLSGSIYHPSHRISEHGINLITGPIWGNQGGQLYINHGSGVWHCDHCDITQPYIPGMPDYDWRYAISPRWANLETAYWERSGWPEGTWIGRSDFWEEQVDTLLLYSDWGDIQFARISPMQVNQAIGLHVRFLGHTGQGPYFHRGLWLPSCAVIMEPDGSSAEIIDI